jgi:D-alanyl-D-alanine carboxypeptidase/D-alanyl-D-alanine-endopeptidase (penicillin-binding protein 4)
VFQPLNENRVILSGALPGDAPGRVEQVAVHRPGAWVGRLLADALRTDGVRIGGRARHWTEVPAEGRQPDWSGWTEIGGVDSPPLRELLPAMLRPSQNQYAQLLWLRVGALTAHGPVADGVAPPVGADDATAVAARKAMRAFLARVGLPPDAVALEEGSGLSRRNQVTPRAVTTLLRYVARQPYGEIFRAALPAPGEPGTLAHRLRDLPPGAELRAKTGYLRHTYALSGYLTTADGRPLVFALFLNHAFAPPDRPSPREDLDALVRRLAVTTSDSAGQAR